MVLTRYGKLCKNDMTSSKYVEIQRLEFHAAASVYVTPNGQAG